MRNPHRLRVYPIAEDLAVEAYRITKAFPSDERFGLISQMRRASVSIDSNVAEGCGLNTDKAFIASIHRSLGSSYELDFQRRIACRLEYGNASDLAAFGESITVMCKMLSSLIVSHR